MGSKRQVISIREGSDLDALGNPTGPDHIDHCDVSSLLFKDLTVREFRKEPLTYALRDSRFLNEAAQVGGTVRLDDVFHPNHIVRFQGPRDADGAINVPARVTFDGDLNFSSNGLANFLNGPEALLQ